MNLYPLLRKYLQNEFNQLCLAISCIILLVGGISAPNIIGVVSILLAATILDNVLCDYEVMIEVHRVADASS